MVILGIWKPKDYIHACYLLCLHIILYWLIANWLAKFLDGCFYMTISIISWPSLHVDALQIMKFTNICHCSSWPTWKVFPKTCIGSPAEIRKWERGLGCRQGTWSCFCIGSSPCFRFCPKYHCYEWKEVGRKQWVFKFMTWKRDISILQPGGKDANKQEISQLDALKNPERTRQEQAATKASAAFKCHLVNFLTWKLILFLWWSWLLWWWPSGFPMCGMITL